MRNFFTRRRRSSGRSRTVHSGHSRGSGMRRRRSSGGTVETAIGALVVVVLVLVLLRLVGLF